MIRDFVPPKNGGDVFPESLYHEILAFTEEDDTPGLRRMYERYALHLGPETIASALKTAKRNHRRGGVRNRAAFLTTVIFGRARELGITLDRGRAEIGEEIGEDALLEAIFDFTDEIDCPPKVRMYEQCIRVLGLDVVAAALDDTKQHSDIHDPAAYLVAVLKQRARELGIDPDLLALDGTEPTGTAQQ